MVDNNQRPKRAVRKGGNDTSTGEKMVSFQDRSSGREKRSSAESIYHHRPRVSLPSHMEPTYFIGGGNGNALIEEVLNDLSWKPTKDRYDDGYRLKWCELKTTINYNTFKEGDQMVNHIPNCNLLTNKLGLLNSLQEYDRANTNMKRKAPKLDFIPETLRLDEAKDRATFLDLYTENDLWICKPIGRNQGKGIFIVRNKEDVKQALGEEPVVASASQADAANVTGDENTDQPKEKPTTAREPETKRKPAVPVKLNRIVQRYVSNPLLLEGKKFDIRCYMLVANTVPYLVLYHKGYIRVSLYEYDNDDCNVTAHLTNQFIQKKDPKYKEQKEDTTWSMERFNKYMNEHAGEKGVEPDWVFGGLTTRMKQIMTYCFNSVKHKLASKVGYFDLYGFDFMVDDDMKVWLIEVNVNPCLSTNSKALREVVPGVVRETLYICIECFEKTRKGRSIMPLQSLKQFEIIYNASSKNTQGSSRGYRSQSLSPRRRARSLSPVKEIGHSGGDGPSVKGKHHTLSITRVPQSTRTSNFHSNIVGKDTGVKTNSADKVAQKQAAINKGGDCKRDENIKGTKDGDKAIVGSSSKTDKNKDKSSKTGGDYKMEENIKCTADEDKPIANSSLKTDKNKDKSPNIVKLPDKNAKEDKKTPQTHDKHSATPADTEEVSPSPYSRQDSLDRPPSEKDRSTSIKTNDQTSKSQPGKTAKSDTDIKPKPSKPPQRTVSGKFHDRLGAQSLIAVGKLQKSPYAESMILNKSHSAGSQNNNVKSSKDDSKQNRGS